MLSANTIKEKRGDAVALTRDFKEMIRVRVERDPAFRQALLREAIENLLSGDVETGKVIARDFNLLGLASGRR